MLDRFEFHSAALIIADGFHSVRITKNLQGFHDGLQTFQRNQTGDWLVLPHQSDRLPIFDALDQSGQSGLSFAMLTAVFMESHLCHRQRSRNFKSPISFQSPNLDVVLEDVRRDWFQRS